MTGLQKDGLGLAVAMSSACIFTSLTHSEMLATGIKRLGSFFASTAAIVVALRWLPEREGLWSDSCSKKVSYGVQPSAANGMDKM